MSHPVRDISLRKALHTVCDICGKRRGGTKAPSHAECSKIRQQNGFGDSHK